jgi:hypothetical protein
MFSLTWRGLFFLCVMEEHAGSMKATGRCLPQQEAKQDIDWLGFGAPWVSVEQV